MRVIVNLSARGRISANGDNELILNGNSIGKILGLMLGADYIENGVIKISVADANEKTEELYL